MNRKKRDFGIVVKQLIYIALWVVENKKYLLVLLALSAGLITYSSIKNRNGGLEVNYDSRETALAACLEDAEQWTNKELMRPNTYLKNSEGDFQILKYICYPAAEKGYVGVYIPKVNYLKVPTNDGEGNYSIETVIANPSPIYTWERTTNKRSWDEISGNQIKVKRNK